MGFFACAVCCIPLTGCTQVSGNHSRVAAAPAPTRDLLLDVMTAGDGHIRVASQGTAQDERLRFFVLPEPDRLRPCCAFGYDLKVKIGAVPVPGFSMQTVRGRSDIGQHSYGAGLVQFASSPVAHAAGQPSRESNGIVYTCRGGFIDTAHLRDYADLTAYLAPQIRSRLDDGGDIVLADQGGTRTVRVRPLPRALAPRAVAGERDSFAIAAAEWVTFELSVWREIATWYGHETVPPWPERISSFSIEDLYSNLLGTRLAGALLATQTFRDEPEYDSAMSAWIDAALDALGVVSQQSAADAMKAVAGVWWDPERRVPDWKVLRRRKFDIDGTVPPWLIESASGKSVDAAPGCKGSQEPVVLHTVDRFDGIAIADVAYVELVVSDKLAAHGFPFPRRGDRHITPRDFPTIVDAIRRETSRALGGPADHP